MTRQVIKTGQSRDGPRTEVTSPRNSYRCPKNEAQTPATGPAHSSCRLLSFLLPPALLSHRDTQNAVGVPEPSHVLPWSPR